MQNIRRDLYKAKLREGQLFNSPKKAKPTTYNKSLAEKHRIQSAIDTQAFICSNLEHQYGDITTTPGGACTAASSFFASPQDNSSPFAKKRCITHPYQKKERTVDYNFPDTSMDGELARALNMAETPNNTTIATTTNHTNLKVMIESKVEDTTGRKTSGETPEDYDNGGYDEEGEKDPNLNGSIC